MREEPKVIVRTYDPYSDGPTATSTTATIVRLDVERSHSTVELMDIVPEPVKYPMNRAQRRAAKRGK